MNASGRPNTCKSRGKALFGEYTTGERVRNAYATYLYLEHSPEKSGLIFHTISRWHHPEMKAPAGLDGHA